MACPPVRGDSRRVLARESSPVQVYKQWYHYFISPTSLEPRQEISYNVVCATCKGSDQPAHT